MVSRLIAESNRLTALGNDNLGGLSFTYGLETNDTVNSGYVFNAHDAVWITFARGLFDACEIMYRNRESAGCFNTTNFLAKTRAWQDTRPERVWVADAQRKYLRPYEDNGTETYLAMLAGKKTHQREQVKTYNAYYYASKYVSDYCTMQKITLRGYGGAFASTSAVIKMYIDCYAVVTSTSNNVIYKERVKRGVKCNASFDTVGNLQETELYFCTAPMITELSGLAGLYCKYNDFSMATNLQRLEIGSAVSGYSNTNLEGLNIGTNKMLEYLDVRNCPNAGTGQGMGALNLSGCISLKELYLENTAFTSVSFANGGLLEIAHLPSSISILTLSKSIYLEDLTIESVTKLTQLTAENCSFDDSAILTIGSTSTTQAVKDIILNIIESSTNLSRIRIIGLDWSLAATTLLNTLLGMSGIGDDGYGTQQSVLTGEVYVSGSIRNSELDNYALAWNDLEVTYNSANLITQYLA